MERGELQTKYLRLAEDAPKGTLVPLGEFCRDVVRDLATLDDAMPRFYDTREFARLRGGVKPKTVTNWCGQGKISGAFKTSTGKGGKWQIPAKALKAKIPRTRTSNKEAA